MSDVNPNDTRIFNGLDDVLHFYDGAGAQSKAGIEVELCFFDPSAPGLPPMNVAQNLTVQTNANNICGEECVRNEPSSDMLEVSSIARGPDGLAAVLKNMNDKIKFLTRTAADIGLKRSWFQEIPHVTAQALFENVVDIPRYNAFFNPPRADMIDIAAYFFVCKSNQVSVSYRDHDHMLENIRRLYFLTPFLFLLTDNSSGFNEGKPFSGHSGMHHRAALKDRGGVMPYMFTAKTGEEYIRAHIDHVMNNPLFVHYDEAGALHRIPSGQWITFNDLKARGLNTATNYWFSQSVLWPDVKIASLKDKSGEVYGHRYEPRMFGVGIHQHQSAFLIVSALAFHQDFADKTDELLKSFGFCVGDPDKSRELLSKAYDAAREHDGKFFDIAYGTGLMADFAQKFADLLEGAYTGQGFDAELAPVLSICRSSWTDGKVNRVLFNTMDKVLKQQRNYDASLFINPNKCGYMLFRKELRQS